MVFWLCFSLWWMYWKIMLFLERVEFFGCVYIFFGYDRFVVLIKMVFMVVVGLVRLMK